MSDETRMTLLHSNTNDIVEELLMWKSLAAEHLDRVTELEAENIRLGIEYQRMRLALGDIAINSKRALNESPTDHLAARLRQERQDDKWIPVSERLPDNWKPVLTIDISKSTRDMVTAFYNPETSLWSTHFSCDLWVTHWMPLPESPIMYGKVCEE